MRVLFMGTPDFASECLKSLYASRHEVIAVFSQPDKPKGRSMKLQPTPVKALALERGTPVYQPEKLRDGTAADLIRSLQPDVLAVVAYGRILPKEILDIPPMGCINIHGSLLPAYRGSAPIQWAVLNGDKETGVTSMYMAEEMDAGDIIYMTRTEIGSDETSGELFDRLAVMGGELLVKTLDDIESGIAPRTPQNHSRATFAPMISKAMCPIDWNKTPDRIINQILGLQPWPTATAEIAGTVFKVFSARPGTASDKVPGTVLSAGNDGIEVAACGGSIIITELQAPGGKRMRAGDYLRGHPICL